VAQELSGLSSTAAEEGAHGNHCLPVWQVRVERLAGLSAALVKPRNLELGREDELILRLLGLYL
jgi:hypothetical protein